MVTRSLRDGYTTVTRLLRGRYALVTHLLRQALEKANLYSTTLHAINSAVVKLSKLTKATKVYRGVAGGTLPQSFQTPNEYNVCGGIEAAFMSTTVMRDVASAYASSSDGPGLLFSIEQVAVTSHPNVTVV